SCQENTRSNIHTGDEGLPPAGFTSFVDITIHRGTDRRPQAWPRGHHRPSRGSAPHHSSVFSVHSDAAGFNSQRIFLTILRPRLSYRPFSAISTRPCRISSWKRSVSR